MSAIVHASRRVAASAKADLSGDELSDHLREQGNGRYALAPWPWPILTRESRSLMPGSVTLICGAPGASKSWFNLSCLRYWTANNIPAKVLMLEETRKWHLQRALAQCSGNVDLLRPEWIAANRTEAEGLYEKHRGEIGDIRERLVCDGNWTMAKCAEWVEQQCKDRTRVIVIDPISLADCGNEKPWDADRRFMARAKVAVEKSGASLVLVTHPKKGGGSGKDGPPQLDDLAGGAAYGRACASALWVAGVSGGTQAMCVDGDGRVVEASPDKIIRVLKARNSAGHGKVIAYHFHGLALSEIGVVCNDKPQEKPARKRRTDHERMADADEIAKGLT
jgi:hypothetical protein